jgi:hypothetical protein
MEAGYCLLKDLCIDEIYRGLLPSGRVKSVLPSTILSVGSFCDGRESEYCSVLVTRLLEGM